MNTTATAIADAISTIAGTIGSPIESERYANAMAAAGKVAADVTAASAPMSGMRDSLLDRSRRAYHPQSTHDVHWAFRPRLRRQTRRPLGIARPAVRRVR